MRHQFDVREICVISAVGVFSVVAGASLAYLAERCPGHVVVLETSGGVMLIAGLALLGIAMPTPP
jgi:hypothetical protein